MSIISRHTDDEGQMDIRVGRQVGRQAVKQIRRGRTIDKQKAQKDRGK